MKLLTKDAQKKLDQQLQSLQDDVQRLQKQLDDKTKELAIQARELALTQGTASKAEQAALVAVVAGKANLEATVKELEAKGKELVVEKAQLELAKKALGDTKKLLDDKNKAFEVQVKELAASQAGKAKAEQASQAATAATAAGKAQLEALQAQTKSEIDTLKKQAAENTKKLSVETEENQLLLNQLMQVQEELETYYLGQKKFEDLYQGMQMRWMRLEKRYPNYVDFKSVDVVSFDHQGEVPSVTWVVKDYAQGGVAIDEFKFQTVMQDGQPGIGLVDKDNSSASEGVLVPKLLKPQSNQLQRFVRMGQSNFRQLLAATRIIMQMEASDWRDVKLPQDFDLGFWRSSFKVLPSHLQALPILLRYDEVKLKRELINPDYEHLWLEFKELGLGARTWPKFELRLGAALVKPNGFSQFPKIEIPLIDGKIKPFESWYAESQDDSGAKLELRFALDKQIFDTAVWATLDAADKALLIRLIYILPDALRRLETEQVVIHRPWATWVDFAQASAQIIESTRRAAKVKAVPIVTEVKAEVNADLKADIAKESAPALPAPSKKLKSQVKASVKTKPAKSVAQKKTPGKKTSSPQKVAPPPKVATTKKAAPIKKAAPTKNAVQVKNAAPAKKVETPKKVVAPKVTAVKKVTPVNKVTPVKKIEAAPIKATVKNSVTPAKKAPAKKTAMVNKTGNK